MVMAIGKNVREKIAYLIQEDMAEYLSVDEGEITGTGTASFKASDRILALIAYEAAKPVAEAAGQNAGLSQRLRARIGRWIANEDMLGGDEKLFLEALRTIEGYEPCGPDAGEIKVNGQDMRRVRAKPLAPLSPSGEMVERLRKEGSRAGILLVDPPRPTPLASLLADAASLIEAQAAELAMLKRVMGECADAVAGVERDRDDALARATAAETSLSASQEREKALREALAERIRVVRLYMEHDKMGAPQKIAALINHPYFARALTQEGGEC
jgi:hypothetical protein